MGVNRGWGLVVRLMLFITIIIFFTSNALAKEDEVLIEPPAAASLDKAEKESQGEHGGGIQWARFGPSWDHREDYSDKGVNEVVILGGNYLGESWKNTYYFGGAYYYHFNDFIALGAHYHYSPIVIDKNTPFYLNRRSLSTHTATAMVALNTPAAWRAGKKIFNMDFYFTLGVGAMQINKQWETVGVIGGGTRFYFPVPWIAFRLDINSYLHYTPMYPGRKDFSGDIAAGGGISFLFPAKQIR